MLRPVCCVCGFGGWAQSREGGGISASQEGCLEAEWDLQIIPVQEALLFYREIIIYTM